MPIYTYQSEEEPGKTIERIFPHPPPAKIKDHGQWFGRAAVEPIAIVGLGNPINQGDQILKGYHDQECRLGSRFRSRFDADTIKEAWRNDSLTEAEQAADNGNEEASQRMAAAMTNEPT